MRRHEPWDDLPDPREGDHDIEYWVWHEECLVPATPEELAHIQEEERTREAMFRLEQLQAKEQLRAGRLGHRALVLQHWCGRHIRIAVRWLRLRRHGADSHTEGVRAERSSTR